MSFINDFLKNIDFITNNKEEVEFDRNAWEELENFLRGENYNQQDMDFELKPKQNDGILKDFANLEITKTTDLNFVRKAYKRLVLEFHPDKFKEDDSKEKAGEVLRKISESYKRIVAYLKNNI